MDFAEFYRGKTEEMTLVIGVPVVGLILLALYLPDPEIFLSTEFIIFMALIIISNLLAVIFPIEGIYLSMSFPFVLSILIVMGPEAAMWSCVSAAIVYLNKLNLKSIAYNMGQIAISIYIAALVLPENIDAILSFHNFLRILLAALLSDLVNFLLVIRILCLQQGMSFFKTFIDVWIYKMTPIRPLQYSTGIIMAICYRNLGYAGLLLATIPVLGIFYLLNTRTRLQEETFKARTDNVTTVGNKYAMYLWWQEEYPRIRENQLDLNVLMIDIDQFDTILELYGSDIGEQVMKSVARIIEGCIRQGDYLFRYGRDEFVLILPEISVDSAVKVAERVNRAVASAQILPLEHRPVTVSIGLSYLTPDLQGEGKRVPGELLRRADQAMYVARQNKMKGVHVYS